MGPNEKDGKEPKPQEPPEPPPEINWPDMEFISERQNPTTGGEAPDVDFFDIET